MTLYDMILIELNESSHQCHEALTTVSHSPHNFGMSESLNPLSVQWRVYQKRKVRLMDFLGEKSLPLQHG